VPGHPRRRPPAVRTPTSTAQYDSQMRTPKSPAQFRSSNDQRARTVRVVSGESPEGAARHGRGELSRRFIKPLRDFPTNVVAGRAGFGWPGSSSRVYAASSVRAARHDSVTGMDGPGFIRPWRCGHLGDRRTSRRGAARRLEASLIPDGFPNGSRAGLDVSAGAEPCVDRLGRPFFPVHGGSSV